MHLYVPSLLLFTRASVRVPDGAVTKALTFPSPVRVTDLASTVNSVVDSKKTPEVSKKITVLATALFGYLVCFR